MISLYISWFKKSLRTISLVLGHSIFRNRSERFLERFFVRTGRFIFCLFWSSATLLRSTHQPDGLDWTQLESKPQTLSFKTTNVTSRSMIFCGWRWRA